MNSEEWDERGQYAVDDVPDDKADFRHPDGTKVLCASCGAPSPGLQVNHDGDEPEYRMRCDACGHTEPLKRGVCKDVHFQYFPKPPDEEVAR